jgi:hypothetical protein
MAHCIADEKEQMTTDDEDDVLPLTNASVSANVDCTGKAW